MFFRGNFVQELFVTSFYCFFAPRMREECFRVLFVRGATNFFRVFHSCKCVFKDSGEMCCSSCFWKIGECFFGVDVFEEFWGESRIDVVCDCFACYSVGENADNSKRFICLCGEVENLFVGDFSFFLYAFFKLVVLLLCESGEGLEFLVGGVCVMVVSFRHVSYTTTFRICLQKGNLASTLCG